MRLLFPLLLLWGFSAFAADPSNNLQRDGSFEVPSVKGRTLTDQGGNPAHLGGGSGWIAFNFRTTGTSGKVTGGLTDEVAHSGRQSLFIHFDHVDGAFQGALLTSNFIPIVSGTQYDVGIWGRADSKAPFDPDGRSVYLKLEVDYFAKDANESVGQPSFAVQPFPGSKGHVPVFKPDVWNLFTVTFTPPPGAVFAQITWRWETGSDPGETNGLMFFDDASLTGPAPANPNMTPEPVQQDSPAPPQ